MNKHIQHIIIQLILAFGVTYSYAQSVDLEHIGKNIKDKLKPKKLLKISGGFNSNFIFYDGNTGSGREPFTYFFNGNINASIYGVSIPLSFNYTNLGFTYNYQLPQTPNRLSLHPKYKAVTGHIGDVSMSFSPYTFSGYQFRGAGFDIVPKGKLRYSFFYGQLQKANEFNGTNASASTYQRMGYGAKLNYINKNRKVGVIIFRAKDRIESLKWKPDSLNIKPQENTALSLQIGFPIQKNLVLDIEYSASILTRDVRSENYDATGKTSYLMKIFGGKMSTSVYHALKSQLTYTIGNSQLGFGFERVDPGYQTLGAYYFANDLQNVTINFVKPLFDNKVSLSGNVGLQKDNLDNKKLSSTNRTVMAINLNWQPNKKVSIAGQYSSFQTFTNIRPQFQYINQLTPFDNLDTLNFQQLSQTANVNLNYVIASSKENTQNLNMNFSFQDAFDKQGGVIGEGAVSQFYNFSGGYSFAKSPKFFSASTAFNLTYNTIGTNNIVTLGPTIGINKGFWKNKVRTGFSLSYNQSIGNNQNTKVGAARTTTSYTFKKKHSFNLNSTMMLRNGTNQSLIKTYRDLTITLAYNFRF